MEAQTTPPAAPVASAAAGTEKPNGPVVAALYALGVGAVALGLLTTLAEASTWWHDKLEFVKRVGPLSGKTTIAVLAFVVAWLVGHSVLRDRNENLDKAVKVAIVLLILGVIGTFPTFFQAFASK